MRKMCIYEPALCCETGLCGVNVDPELLRISTVLHTLKQEGISIERYNLNSAPMEFVKNNTVNRYVNENGVEGLPVVTLDGEIVIKGRYPANDEILNLLGLPAQILLPKEAVSGSCCCKEADVSDATCCCGETDTASSSCCCEATDDGKEPSEDESSCCCSKNSCC